MAEQTYLMNAKEVADELDCSVDYAYKAIREMNKDLKRQGYFVRAGHVPRAFVETKLFGYKLQTAN